VNPLVFIISDGDHPTGAFVTEPEAKKFAEEQGRALFLDVLKIGATKEPLVRSEKLLEDGTWTTDF
jgi:hypothetical protein